MSRKILLSEHQSPDIDQVDHTPDKDARSGRNGNPPETEGSMEHQKEVESDVDRAHQSHCF